MQRLEHALHSLAERAEPLPAELVVERVERALGGAGEVVVPLRRGGRPTAWPASRRWSGPAIAAAAFLVVLAAGIGVWIGAGLLGGGTGSAGSTAPVATDPTTASVPAPSSADPVAAARDLIPAVEQAFDDGDLSGLPLLPGATVDLSGIGLSFAPGAEAPVPASIDQLAAMLAWEHSIGGWFEMSRCTDEGAAGTVQITCAVAYGDALLDRAGITGGGEIAFRVADGRISALLDHRSGEFGDLYAAKWVTFVLRDHPGEAGRMFTDEGYPVLTEDSAALHVALLEEWARSWGL